MVYTFSIPGIITQIFNPISEFEIRIGIPIKGAKKKKREMETHPVTVETKISNKLFYTSYSLNHFNFFMEIISFFIYIFQSTFLTYVF